MQPLCQAPCVTIYTINTRVNTGFRLLGSSNLKASISFAHHHLKLVNFSFINPDLSFTHSPHQNTQFVSTILDHF